MIRVIIGFIGGIILARNAAPMGAPAFSAILLIGLIGSGLCFLLGYKDKKSAVASAVAIAKAEASAEAEAKAAAMAQSIINFHGITISQEQLAMESMKNGELENSLSLATDHNYINAKRGRLISRSE